MSNNNNNNITDELDHDVQMWKLKRVINSLTNLKGNGTSMISLVIPGNDLVCGYRAMLTNEMGAAANIKSRVNRQSVITAITSALQKLKLYTKAPPNGLIVYTGNVVTDTGKEKKVTIDFEPFKPVNKYYKCDSVFHTEMLSEMLESDTTYGFVIVGGKSTLFGTLCGNTKTTICEFGADLPKKHNKGGQSSARFGRLRDEAIHRYIKKLCELLIQNYITNDIPNVTGLIFGGSGELKNEMIACDFFDYRLKPLILKVVDTSYGGQNGFNQTIDMSVDAIGNMQFVKEKKLLIEYMNELALVNMTNNKVCYGIKDTIYALEAGAIDKLIIWDELTIVRYVLKDNSVVYYEPEIMEKKGLEIMDETLYTDWVAENYKKFGTNLHFVSDRTQEGLQFCMGFGGIGGILRYTMQFEEDEEYIDDNYSDTDHNDNHNNNDF
jgi:peptide chain release factor subunit 1